MPPPSRGAFTRALPARIALVVTRAQGRPGAGWHPQVRVPKECTRGGPRVRRIARPSLRDGFNVSFVLSPGSDALLPPSPCGSLTCVPGWTAHITTGLDAQTPGVRTTRLVRPRTSPHVASSAGVCSHPKPCEDAVGIVSSARKPLLTAEAALQCNRARRRRVHRCPTRGS